MKRHDLLDKIKPKARPGALVIKATKGLKDAPSHIRRNTFALVSNFNHGWTQNAYCNRPLLISMINRVLKQIGNGTLYRLTITTDVNDFGIVIENHVVSSSECERRHIRNHLPGSGDNIYRMKLV